MYDADSLLTEVIRQQAATAKALQLDGEIRRLNKAETEADLLTRRSSTSLAEKLRRVLTQVIRRAGPVRGATQN